MLPGSVRTSMGRKPPLVVGNFRAQDAFDGVDRIGVGVVVGHVHGAVDLGRGARVVDDEGISGLLYPRPHPNGFRQTVGLDFRRELPVGQAAQGVAHGLLRAALDLFRQRAQIIQAVFIQQIAQALFRQAVRRELGVDVAHHQVGHAHVVADEVDERPVGLAAPVHLHHRDLEALLVDLPRVGRADFPADVRQVGRAGREPDEFLPVEHRLHDVHVGQMAGPVPDVVGDEDVAGLQRLGRKRSQEMTDRYRQGADERGDAGGGLHEGVALIVSDHAREIVRLAHERRERGAHQRRRRLVHDADEPPPEHFQRDGIERHQPSTSMTMWPPASFLKRAS